MQARQRLTYATYLLLGGALLSLGWVIVSFVFLFELGDESLGIWRVLEALGPLGLIMVILGGSLCRWDLPALRREVRGE